MTGLGLRGRRLARLMVAAVLAVDGFLILLVGHAPTAQGGMFVDPPGPPAWLVVGIGIALHLVGLAWMLRIWRADPEAHRSWWRFDRF